MMNAFWMYCTLGIAIGLVVCEFKQWLVPLMSVTLNALLCACIVNVAQQELIGIGAGNLEALDAAGNTALISASRRGKIEMVKLLHDAKSDLNACGRYGTALHGAVRNGHTEMVKVTQRERTQHGCLMLQ